MSIATTNPFALLGDEDASAAPRTAPVDKKNTSSKKQDVAPAKADPARAKNNKKPATGNEAAYKNKPANKSTPAPVDTARQTRRPGRLDRHSATGKTDTKKKEKKGWGDDNKELQEEQAGEQLAKEDAQDDETPAAQAQEDNTKTLEQYLADLSTQTAGLEGARQLRKANEGQDDAKWGAQVVQKEQEQLFAAQKTKTLKAKSKKEKQVLEADLTFAAPQREQRESRPQRGGRGQGAPRGNRGGPSRGRGAAPRGGAGRGGKAAPVNLTSDQDFPSLGA